MLGPLAHGVNPGTAGSSPSAEGGSQGHWVWSQQRIEQASDHWPPVQKGWFTLHFTSLCLSGLDFAGRVVCPQSTAEGGGQPSPVPAQDRTGQDAGVLTPPTPLLLVLTATTVTLGPWLQAPLSHAFHPPLRVRGSQRQSMWAPGDCEVSTGISIAQ